MKASQRIDGGSNANQQIQAEGEVSAPFAVRGGISIAGDNHGIVVTSVPSDEHPPQTFNIAKKTRIPTPTSLIASMSALVTLIGFFTGAVTVKQFVDAIHSAARGLGLPAVGAESYWWAVATALAIGLGALGLQLVRFLRRNVLRLPKHWTFRAWAGIREASGRTYPYSLRLSMKCAKCANQKLRFMQIPARWTDYFDGNGTRTTRSVTEWASMAVCPRDDTHSVRVDVSGNDFDQPLPR